MKKTFKKSFATFLAGLMCMSAMGLTSFAAEKTDLGTTWYGDELKVGVTAGNNGYTFRSVYQEKKPAAYEMSNHMVTNGGINQIPQLLVMVDASKDYTWTPDGLYTLGESNFEALYCCDAETGYNDGIYYKRMNLEDSDYYSDEAAKHIRAIVTNSYPYVSLSEMKDSLKKAGFEGAEELTRAEIITAVQSAIWAYANKDIAPYEYVHTFDVPTNTQWGRVIHDFTGEMKVWWTTGYRQFSKDETVRARINTLIDYLKGLEPVSAKADQIIISRLEIADTATGSEADDLYNVALKVTLNNAGSNENDDLIIKVYADGELAGEEKVVSGITEYIVNTKATAGQKIKAVVSGIQYVAKGAYFYEPEGGRGASQCLVGVAEGKTDVYAEKTIVVGGVSFASGKASNISFMEIDNDGNITFIKKIDLDSDDNIVFFNVEATNAIFVKQATTGMLWVSEEAFLDRKDDLLACVEENNPSYKGYGTVAFGSGEHNLNFNNNKVVTYTFTLPKAE